MSQVCGLYRPYKLVNAANHSDQFKVQIREVSDFIKDNENFVILGDFNLDYNKLHTQNYIHRRLYDEWSEFSNAFDLVQLIEEVTWS